MKKFLEKHWLAFLVILGIVGIAATGVVVPYTQYTLQLLQSQNSGAARSLLGVTTTAANNTNQTLVTPTLQGGTGNAFTNNGAVDNYGTHNGGNFSGPTNVNPWTTGGTSTGSTNVNPWTTAGTSTGSTNVNPWTTGGTSTGSTNRNGYTTNEVNVNGTFNGASGSFSGNGYGMTNTFAAGIQNGQPVYIGMGFDNFIDPIGCSYIVIGTDGKTFYAVNAGKSVYSGIAPGLTGTEMDVPAGLRWTNGLFYVLANGIGSFESTNLYISVTPDFVNFTNIAIIHVFPGYANATASQNVYFPSRWGVDLNGKAFITGTYTTNGGGNYKPVLILATDGTLQNYSQAVTIGQFGGGNVRSGIDDIDDFQPSYSGSNWVALTSSLGHYGLVYTNAGTDISTNWQLCEQLLTWGEGFNEMPLPDGSNWAMYYDDGPNNATIGETRYHVTASAIPDISHYLSTGPVTSKNVYLRDPFVAGITMPFRHFQITLTTNLPPAMWPAALAAVNQGSSILYGLDPTNSPTLYPIETPTGIVMTNLNQSPVTPASLTGQNPLNTGLILDCTLIEGSGTNVLDYSPNALNGFITGLPAVWTNGLVGNALAQTNSGPEGSVWLTGVTNAEQVPIPPQLASVSNGFTFEVWFYQTNWGPSGECAILYVGNPGQINAFYVDLFANGYGTFIQGPATGNQFNDGASTTNMWVDYVATFNNATLSIYTNSVLLTTHAWANGFTNVVSLNSIVGFGGMRAGGMNGRCRMWDRCLNANEVRMAYDQLKAP